MTQHGNTCPVHAPAIAGTILVVLLALAAPARAGESAEQPHWAVDDSWTYVRTSFATAQNPTTMKTRIEWKVVSVKEGDFYATIYNGTGADGKSSQSRHRWSAALNYMNRVGSGEQWQEFKWYQWPLSEGATWETHWFSPAFGETQSWNARVRGWETITVPAGTFRALRVELDNACYYKGVDGGICRQEDIVWYAPEVKRNVRLERRTFSRAYMGQNIVDELESYRVR